jgi:uncharacterized membrane protein HdeD (DUF308 family)
MLWSRPFLIRFGQWLEARIHHDCRIDRQGVAITENRAWFMALGIILIGIAAVAFPFLTTIATKAFLGWLLLIGGTAQTVHAFYTQRWSEFSLNLLIGALYLLVGGWFAFIPLAGVVALTLLLAVMFIVDGVTEIGMGLRIRPQEGWIWLIVAGVIAILAGALIIAHLPSSADWAIGLLVGISIISAGWAYVFLAMAAGKIVAAKN